MVHVETCSTCVKTLLLPLRTATEWRRTPTGNGESTASNGENQAKVRPGGISRVGDEEEKQRLAPKAYNKRQVVYNTVFREWMSVRVYIYLRSS